MIIGDIEVGKSEVVIVGIEVVNGVCGVCGWVCDVDEVEIVVICVGEDFVGIGVGGDWSVVGGVFDGDLVEIGGCVDVFDVDYCDVIDVGSEI